nr:hypothetical protein CFP56_51175 [Quercus suber]
MAPIWNALLVQMATRKSSINQIHVNQVDKSSNQLSCGESKKGPFELNYCILLQFYMEAAEFLLRTGLWVSSFCSFIVRRLAFRGRRQRDQPFFSEIMDSSQSSVLENELSVVIVDQQEEAQVEPTHGSPSRSNTPSRHDKQNVEVPKVGMKLIWFKSGFITS